MSSRNGRRQVRLKVSNLSNLLLIFMWKNNEFHVNGKEKNTIYLFIYMLMSLREISF